jgi:hypothetical protein
VYQYNLTNRCLQFERELSLSNLVEPGSPAKRRSEGGSRWLASTHMSVNHGAVVVGAAVVTDGMSGRAPPPSWAALQRKRKFAPEILERHTSQGGERTRRKERGS